MSRAWGTASCAVSVPDPLHACTYHSSCRRSKPRSDMPSREGPQHPTLPYPASCSGRISWRITNSQSRQCLPRPAPITGYTARSRGIPARGLSQPAPPAKSPPFPAPRSLPLPRSSSRGGQTSVFPIPMCHRRPSGWEDHRLGVAIPRHRLPSHSRSNACSSGRTITSLTRLPLHIFACAPSPFPAVEACTRARLMPGSWHRIGGHATEKANCVSSSV